MKTTNYFYGYFESIGESLLSIKSEQFENAAAMVWETHKSGKKVILVGNGGSAAMASHVAVDFTKAAGIRAINFNEADLITCLANDFGYEHWVSKAMEFFADPGDLAILISSSGKSQNILNGCTQARSMELSIITFSGFSKDNPLSKQGDINFWLGNTSYNIIEMTHHIWLVSIIDYLIQTKRKEN